MLEDKRICILGAGAMGEALIAGLLQNKLIPANQIAALGRNAARLNKLKTRYGIEIPMQREAIEQADIIMLAVKPKDIEEALLEVKHYTNDRQLFISVIAGVSTKQITRLLEHQAPVIRTMPNTSATIGLSATGLAAGHYVSEYQLQLAVAIFASVGIVELVTEDKLDAVTGLSGSGPAYIYYLVEGMQRAGEEIGLEPDVARSLILQTIIGAAHMLLETMEEPSELRRNVTSPNGTTAAGIEVLERFKFQEAIIECIKWATLRSAELRERTLS